MVSPLAELLEASTGPLPEPCSRAVDSLWVVAMVHRVPMVLVHMVHADPTVTAEAGAATLADLAATMPATMVVEIVRVMQLDRAAISLPGAVPG